MNDNTMPPEQTPVQAAPEHRTFTTEEKVQWSQKFLSSGLSLRSFSKEHQLPRMSLWRWTKRSAAGTTVASRSTTIGGFAELKLPVANSEWAVELTLPNGTVLRMSRDVPPVMVEQLLRLC